ncbi:MAG: hypothetical protein OXU45_07120 [Candidatus Melainabacteria bacterium]|nr:hypothetical protein [Candidatus Melainabacteria bacterium]
MIDAEKINRLSSSNWDPIDLRPQKIQSQRTPDEYLSLPGYIGGIRVACDRAEAERLAASRNDEINSTVGAKTCLDGTEYTVLASKAGGSRDAISISISEPKNLWGDTFFIAPGAQD